MSNPDLVAQEKAIISHLERVSIKADHALKEIASEYVRRHGLHRDENIFEKVLSYERNFWDKLPDVLALITKWIDNVSSQLHKSSSTIFARNVQHQCWIEWLTRIQLDPWLFDPEDHPACHAHANEINQLFIKSCKTIVWSQFSLEDTTNEHTQSAYQSSYKSNPSPMEAYRSSLYRPSLHDRNEPVADTDRDSMWTHQNQETLQQNTEQVTYNDSPLAESFAPPHRHRPIMLPPTETKRETVPEEPPSNTFKISGLSNSEAQNKGRRKKHRHKNSRSSRRRSRSTLSDDDSDDSPPESP